MAKHFRILVVEDHNDSREMLEEFLTEEGFTVETAVNGLQALERLQYEVDELVIQTVHRAERHALGESPQLSFVLAIEQARAALADRRAILSAREA